MFKTQTKLVHIDHNNIHCYKEPLFVRLVQNMNINKIIQKYNNSCKNKQNHYDNILKSTVYINMNRCTIHWAYILINICDNLNIKFDKLLVSQFTKHSMNKIQLNFPHVFEKINQNIKKIASVVKYNEKIIIAKYIDFIMFS